MIVEETKREKNEKHSGKRRHYPFWNNKFYTLQNSKAIANDIFKFDENGGKFSKRVYNIVGKGGIACYEQFLLYPLCFQKTAYIEKQGPVWERINVFL